MTSDWAEFECPTLGMMFSLLDAYLEHRVMLETSQGIIINCPYCDQAHFYSCYEWVGRGE